MIETTDHVGILYFRLFIPLSGSLKSKRSVLKSIKDRIHNRYNVSVAEIGDMDKWQSAVLGVCAINSDQKYLDQQLQDILSFVEREGNIHLAEHKIEFI